VTNFDDERDEALALLWLDDGDDHGDDEIG